MDDLPGLSSIVRQKILYVFQQEDWRPLDLGNCDDVEEKCSLRGVLESMFTSKAVLLRNAGYRKRLAGKPSGKHIMVRNGLRRDLRDVALRIVLEPRLVGFLTVTVPL